MRGAGGHDGCPRYSTGCGDCIAFAVIVPLTMLSGPMARSRRIG